MQHQDRQISMSDYRLGAAPKNLLAQTRVPVGTHHHQVGATGFGYPREDLGRWLAIRWDNLNIGWNAMPAKLRNSIVYCCVRLFSRLADRRENDARSHGKEWHCGRDSPRGIGCLAPTHDDGADKIGPRLLRCEKDWTPTFREQVLKKIGGETIWMFRSAHHHEIAVSSVKQKALARVVAFFAPARRHRMRGARHIHHIDCRFGAKFVNMACRSGRSIITLLLQ